MADAIILARGLTKRFGEFTAVDAIDLEVERGVDLRLPRRERLGQEHDDPHADRPAHADGGHDRARRHRRDRASAPGARAHRLHGPEGEPVRGAHAARERRVLRRPLRHRRPASSSSAGARCASASASREAEHERPENLPAGVRQRAGLALATLHAPRVLFLDEPTAGVDVESRGLFWELIQDASDAGVTVFVTTHFLEEADYCDRVAFIDAGRLVADSTPEGLRARYSSGYRDRGDARARRARARARRARRARASRPRRRATALVARIPALDTAALAAARRALGPEAAASVRIEQASMNDVFRRLMREGAGAGRGEPPRERAPPAHAGASRGERDAARSLHAGRADRGAAGRAARLRVHPLDRRSRTCGSASTTRAARPRAGA